MGRGSSGFLALGLFLAFATVVALVANGSIPLTILALVLRIAA